MDGAAEDGVAAEQAREEGVVVALFARGRGVFEEEHGGLVDEGEEAQVARVLPRGFVDEPAFRAEAGGLVSWAVGCGREGGRRYVRS